MALKQIYGGCLNILSSVAGIGNAKKFDAWFRFRRKLNLKNPRTLADKVSYLELFDQHELAPMCTDKYAVRQYIQDKGLGHILVPLVGGPWSKVEDVDFDTLPNAFALKATHGCKMNYLVSDKTNLDKEDCVKKMRRWLATTYGTYSVEPHYLKIPHRIYAEKHLGDMSQLVDYKFHCLNGVPQFVLTTGNRHLDSSGAMKATKNLYDINWNPINGIAKMASEVEMSKPTCFDEMLDVARKLSEDFKFVRVDLYEIDGEVLFGELTFSPACCVFPSFTDEFIEKMGEKLDIVG